MKEPQSSSSSSSSSKDDELNVPPKHNHRRTHSFSSLAKSYISKGTDKTKPPAKLSKLSNGSDNGVEESKQLIAILEHQVNEGKRVRQEMADEIAKLKDQLQKAEAHISLLKLELQRKVLSSVGSSPPQPSKHHDTERSCVSEYDDTESPFTKSCDSDMQWDFNPNTTSDPLNTSMYQGSIDEDEDSDSEFSINAIINTINMDNYNNISQMQYNNMNGVSYIINNNNINNITNYNTTTNNIHTVNNITTGSSESSMSFVASSAPCTPRDKEKRSRLFSRTTTHHKRRGSDTESQLKLEEKYQRRHSEGKVIRIAGIREQVKLTLRQLLATNHAEMEDEWPLIQVILQGMDVCDNLPPPPRHLVHFGFVHEGDQEDEYWIDETLLLHFRNFLLIASQPKADSIKRYVFKEILRLSSTSTVASWNTQTDHYGFSVTAETGKREFLNTAKEERDKWVAIINKQVSMIPVHQEECFQHYLISPCEGFVVEPTMVIPLGESKLSLEEPKKGIYHYQSFFYNKPHSNYIGGTNDHPVALSIEDKTARFALSPSLLLRRSSTDASTANGSASGSGSGSNPEQERIVHRVLVRSISGDECVCVAVPAHLARSSQVAHAEIISQLAHLHGYSLPSHLKIGTTIFRVKSPDLETELLNYEASNMRKSHKIGIVYCPKGATTEMDMFSADRQAESADFRNFLALLGNEVALKGWKDYNGGLDVKNESDGTHSIFTNFWGISMMFHVSTMLPTSAHNPIVAKRHIGNDIVVIIFKDHDDNTLLVPSIFKSHLNHIFCVVQQVNNPDASVSYKVSFCAKEGIGGFTPPLPSPPVFAKDARFKHFLLAKIVNAERAALRSPPFAKRHALARNAFLQSLWKQYHLTSLFHL